MTRPAIPEKLQSVHPVLSFPEVTLLFNEEVTKVTKHKNVLVILTCGMFVVRKRSFPSGYQLKQIIPWNQLKRVAIEQNVLEIQGAGKKIKLILDDNAPMIMAICYTMRVLLFGEKDFDVSREVKDAVDKGIFIPEDSCELVDRYLSLCLRKHWPLGLVEQVKSHLKMLKECRHRFVLTPDLAVSPLIRQVLECVASSNAIKVLQLEQVNVELYSAMLLDDLLNVNTSISEIVFSSANLASADDHLTIFSKDLKTPIVSAKFVSCDMGSPGINRWLTDLGGYQQRKFESLEFQQCQVDTALVLKRIVQSQSLHGLSRLVIGDSKVDQEMFEHMYVSDWSLRNKPLKKVKLNNNGINVGAFLPLLFQFDGGLEKLTCTQNDFSKPFSSQIKSFFSLQKLDLSSSSVTAESLDSLFEALTKPGPKPTSVILNNLSMKFDDATMFYRTMDKYVMQGVEVFSWVGNKVPKDCIPTFFSFLQKQPDLRDLTISHVLHANTPNIIPLLCSTLKAMKLQRLVMRGKIGTTFGPDFNEVLKVFRECENLFAVDIIGHKIGDQGLRILSELLEMDRFVAVAFDGTCATSLDLVCSIVELITKTRDVSYAAWPEIDIKCLLSKVPSAQKVTLFRRVEDLKKAFFAKFGHDGRLPVARNMTSATRGLRGSSVSLIPKSEPTKKYQDPRAIAAVLSVRDCEISKLMTECMDFSVLNPENDVLVRTFESIQGKIRFDY